MLPLYILRPLPLLSLPCCTPLGTPSVDPWISWKFFAYESPSMNLSLPIILSYFDDSLTYTNIPNTGLFFQHLLGVSCFPTQPVLWDGPFHYNTDITSLSFDLLYTSLESDWLWANETFFCFNSLCNQSQLLCNHGQNHMPAKLHVHGI